MQLRSTLVVSMATAWISGCALINGLSELERVDADPPGNGGSGGITSSMSSSASGSTGATGGSGGSNGCSQGYVCTTQVPGATYVSLSQSCGMDMTPLQLLDCNACTCDAMPGTCRIKSNSRLDDDAICGGGGGVTISGPNCVPFPGAYNPMTIYVKAEIEINTAGSCQPNTPTPTAGCQLDNPTPCDMAGGNGVCVPSSDPLCINVPAGTNDCTAYPGYPTLHSLYQGGSCNCGGCAVDTETCDDQLTLYSDNTCINQIAQVTANNTCQLTSGITSVSSVKAPDSSNVTCAQPTSSPSGGTAYLLCCQDSP